MARSRRAKRWTPHHLAELGCGVLLTGVLRPAQCQRDDLGRRYCDVCDRDDAPLRGCRSNFADLAEQEGFYWQFRDEILEGYAHLHGQRPWSWWTFEAPGVCRHKPRCPLPRDAGDYRQAAARSREWLVRHGQLTARERAGLAREDADEEKRRRAIEAARDPRSHYAGCTCRQAGCPGAAAQDADGGENP